MEDTGHCHLPVVTLLVEKGIFTCYVNVLRMKKLCSQSIRRAKTDKNDAVHISQFGLAYWGELLPKPPEDVYQELKLLARQYYQMVFMFIKAKVNLNNILDQTMPDIKNLMNDSPSNHKLTDFVKRYYHYAIFLK